RGGAAGALLGGAGDAELGLTMRAHAQAPGPGLVDAQHFRARGAGEADHGSDLARWAARGPRPLSRHATAGAARRQTERAPFTPSATPRPRPPAGPTPGAPRRP